MALPDDASIPADAAIWRRIPHWHLVPNGNTGRIQITNKAFDNDPNGDPMSAVWGDAVTKEGRKADSVAKADGYGFALATFRASIARGQPSSAGRVQIAVSEATAMPIPSYSRVAPVGLWESTVSETRI